MSYSTFSIANATVSKTVDSISALPAEKPTIPGGNPELWETLYEITAPVTNTGDVAGSTVAQLYLSLPQIPNEATTPVKALRGFEKVWLEPSETASVKFPLQRRDISYWSTQVYPDTYRYAFANRLVALLRRGSSLKAQ